MRLLVLLTFVQVAIGSFQAAVAEPKLEIWTKANPEKVKKVFPKAEVRKLNSIPSRRERFAYGLLPGHQKTALFAKLGLTQKVKRMDEVDKDRLILDAQALPLQRLAKVYPSFSKETLRKLQYEIKALRQ